MKNLIRLCCLGAVSVFSSTTPEQRFVAFAGEEAGSAASVSWWTGSSTATSVVQYGPTSALGSSGTGSSRAIPSKSNDGENGYTHNAVMTDLKPHTQYYYKVGDPTGGWSDVETFETARAAGDMTEFTVAVVGDMGIDHSNDTVAALTKSVSSYDFINHIGDLAYADDFFLRHDGVSFEDSWNVWGNKVEHLSSQQAYMVMPGNHEADCSEELPFLCRDYESNFTNFRYRFRMPFEESGGVENMWYSYDYGMAHFVSLSTETDFPGAAEGSSSAFRDGPFGDQVGWLENDLAQAYKNRDKVPWIIVSGHRPLYCSDEGAHEKDQRAAFEGLFLKYGVDLYLSGHVHSYERLYPVIKNEVWGKNYTNPPGPVYIVNGASGNVEGHQKLTPHDWSAYINDQDYGYGLLTFYNATTMHWQFYTAAEDALEDEVIITKTRATQSVSQY